MNMNFHVVTCTVDSRCDVTCDVISCSNGSLLPWLTEMRYLGVFLANVNSRSRSLYAIARPSVVCLSVSVSVVCNVHAPYSGGSNFRQYFCGIRYHGHPVTSTENSTEIVPGEPLRRGS